MIAVQPDLPDGQARKELVSTASDVMFCQDNCLAVHQTYYQFEPGTGRCVCFSKCKGLISGMSTVGSLKFCRKAEYLQIKTEEDRKEQQKIVQETASEYGLSELDN